VTTAPRAVRRFTQASLDLLAACHRILSQIQPASVRAVCYRLFVEALIASMAKANTNRISALLARSREEGQIPWSWIVDETRAVERVGCWPSLAPFATAVKRSYRRDHWASQPTRLEVWSEKGTVRGTLAPVLDRYRVPFRVLHGFSSATVIHDIAVETAADRRPLTALYGGDWDVSGMFMSEADLPRRLALYGAPVTLVRLALTAEDVGDPALPSFEAITKTTDTRYRWFVARYGNTCWELDALNPNVLRARVEAAIRARLDLAAWAASEALEREEQRRLARWRMR
jgi:hypothetical protein